MVERAVLSAITIDGMRARITELEKVAQAVEEWWLSEGMKHFDGAPYAIFAIHAALKETRP